MGDKKVELRRVLFLRSVFFLPLLLTGGFLTKQDQLAAPVLLPSGDPRHEGPGHDGFGACCELADPGRGRVQYKRLLRRVGLVH